MKTAFDCPRQLGFILAACTLLMALAACRSASAAEGECDPRIVAVFDIGSGTLRMQVADIAACRELESPIVLRREVAMGFAADLAKQADGRFSTGLMERATAAVSELLETARAVGAEEWFGVATAAFRRSANASHLVDEWWARFGLWVDIISQQEEGRLAYRMIEAGLADSESRALVVWDIGAGSQQMVWRNPDDGSFKYFNSPLASITFRNQAMAELGRPAAAVTPNPIMPDELERLSHVVREWALSEVPAGLLQRIAEGARVVGVGGVHGASLIGQAGRRPGDELTRNLLVEVLESRLGLNDEALGGAYADTEVTNLILVLELMKVYGIEIYQATRADLTDALLLQAASGPVPSVQGRSPP